MRLLLPAVLRDWRGFFCQNPCYARAIHLAYRREYEALVLFSSDTDLLPALEMVRDVGLGHIEVACWSGFKPLRFPKSNLPWCHFLSRQDWLNAIEDWQGRI